MVRACSIGGGVIALACLVDTTTVAVSRAGDFPEPVSVREGLAKSVS
jgi:hypothetical protein